MNPSYIEQLQEIDTDTVRRHMAKALYEGKPYICSTSVRCPTYYGTSASCTGCIYDVRIKKLDYLVKDHTTNGYMEALLIYITMES